MTQVKQPSHLYECLGKTEAWMVQRFGPPLSAPPWHETKSSVGNLKILYRFSVRAYTGSHTPPNQLNAFFRGKDRQAPVVTQLSWLSFTKNGWTAEHAAQDVGVRLRDLKPVPADKGYPEAQGIYVLRSNKKIRFILFNANGSRWFQVERTSE